MTGGQSSRPECTTMQGNWRESLQAVSVTNVVWGEPKRADFVTLTLEGQRLVRDVMVTASPAPWDAHGEHICTSEAAKATKYNTAGGLTHDKARLLPLIHDARNHWLGRDALALLHRLVHVHARQQAPASLQAWTTHLSNTAAEAAANLLHATVLAAWGMHVAAFNRVCRPVRLGRACAVLLAPD